MSVIENPSGEPTDPLDEVERREGTSTLKDTEKPSGLTDAANKPHPAPAGEPWKDLKSH